MHDDLDLCQGSVYSVYSFVKLLSIFCVPLSISGLSFVLFCQSTVLSIGTILEHSMAKQELSLKQQYQRLTQAKAQATRNGQPTPKLDKKIEKMKAMMGSTVQKVPAAKPSASKFVDYKGVNKLPMQGGACTPK